MIDMTGSAEEIIKLAIRGEEDAAAFYHKVSKMIKNDLVRARYESLAREEEQHRHILISLYHRLTGKVEDPILPEGDFETAEGGFPVALDSIEDALKFAIERESQAAEFYRKLAERTDDHDGKKILDYLADIERSHKNMLESELEAYLRDKDWYKENPKIKLNNNM
ncbi:MAG: ferritin family protein [Pseudomonadota bacterium]